jgi:S-DNA-T family DNA segregation ATPase FtsK/SpoIIIE
MKNIFSFNKKKKKSEISSSKRLFIGSTLIIISLFLFISIFSYFFNGYIDQSSINYLLNDEIKSANYFGKLGAYISHYLVYMGFGIASLILPILIFISSLHIMLSVKNKNLYKRWLWGLYLLFFFSIFFGTVKHESIYSGVIGFEITEFLKVYIKNIGIIFLLIFMFILYITIRLDFGINNIISVYEKLKSLLTFEKNITSNEFEENVNHENDNENSETLNESSYNIDLTKSEKKDEVNLISDKDISELEIQVEKVVEEKSTNNNLANNLVDDFGEFDPKLDLSKFKFPDLNLLKQYNSGQITIDKQELEENKNKIVETLNNYNISISNIKATIGPTVTLYEIVPDAGIRISKIKNLEDDIALSLSALGIRIIAPIPGKGTIGIEVPNKNPTIVSMYSVIAADKFQKSSMELPIAIGKTINNETLVFDLAKMPHLLMAGATGQGKSVGLNAVLTSLLYKKHPAEVKFVLVDPKKVELTLYNKIERHYLAKLPDSEEAIITDNTKVINTLNSLCIEMDNRYEMLKNASCRNIVEYNNKFKQRKLNPNDGHSFLPYIILVVDEFADLIMTAGKQVETPIARLAQLARAIGIHLIIATQRPSVNVITGVIKANFPARIAFRVTSKIDSRTILDSSGADQLIGRGDMLFTQGNEIVRIQCAFVDSPEIERITEFIGSQKAYPTAYKLPEYISDDGGTNIDISMEDRDALFKEAAEVLVIAQQGSASLLQRKLKLGYNRAGRLIDQLEAAGIVGPFEGSKARKVLISNLDELNKILEL